MINSEDHLFNEEEQSFDYDIFWEETLSPYDENYLARYKNDTPDHIRPIGDLIDELFYRRRDSRLFRRKIRLQKKCIIKQHFIYGTCFILFIAGLFINNDISNKTAIEVFEENYTSYLTDKGIDEGLSAYMRGNYDYAMNYLADSIFINGKWLRAISMIEEEEFSQAAIILSEINSTESEWLRALCLMRAGNNIKAVKEFEKIYLEKGFFSKHAKKILEEHYYKYHTKKAN